MQQQYGGVADLISFDWDKPASFSTALQGIDVVALVPPPVVDNNFHVTAAPFIQAAIAAGIKHVVLTTALYADRPDSIFYATEALVQQSGIPYTIIRPGFVFQNFLQQFLQSIRSGAIVAPSETGKTSYVDVRNVGEATALVLADPAAHTGKVYAITGSEALSHKEMAAIFSHELGKEVVHISPTPDQFKQRLADLEMPPLLYEFLAVLYGTIAKGQWATVSRDFSLLTGKCPARFADFVQEYRNVFLGIQ